MKPRLKINPRVRGLFIAVLVFAGLYTGCLYIGQRQLIYYPRDYNAADRAGMHLNTAELQYETDSGEQSAFYVAPPRAQDEVPESIYVVFVGNATVALDWQPLVRKFPNETTAYLLFDYPGYGNCEGKPSRPAIMKSYRVAMERLADHLNRTEDQLEERLNVIGQSLGGAVALDFATEYSVEQIILISPFTSMVDMARRVVGWPLCHLVKDRYDNVARLEELSQTENPPDVFVFHAADDRTIPVEMSREMADRFPELIHFVLKYDGGHTLVSHISEEIAEIISKNKKIANGPGN